MIYDAFQKWLNASPQDSKSGNRYVYLRVDPATELNCEYVKKQKADALVAYEYGRITLTQRLINRNKKNLGSFEYIAEKIS